MQLRCVAVALLPLSNSPSRMTVFKLTLILLHAGYPWI
jgi:hypothetical protein